MLPDMVVIGADAIEKLAEQGGNMIFVTTASGALGGRVIEALLAQGEPPGNIVAGGRNLEKLEGLAERGVVTRAADYTDKAGLEAAFAGIDTLVLIPSSSAVTPRLREHANCIDAAKAAGVRRVVFLSLVSVAPDSVFLINPFLLYGESAIRLSGLDWVMLRMNLFLDPLADWAPDLARAGHLPYPVKSGKVAYVSRDDIARATAAAARQPGLKDRIFELTGPDAVSMNELAAALSDATGSEIAFKQVSEPEFRKICADDGTPDFITDVLASIYRAVDRGEYARASDDIASLTGTPAESVACYLNRRLKPAAG